VACGGACEIYGQQVVNPNSLLPVYSTPARRGGEAGIFVADILEFLASANLDIRIEHKNSEDTTWTAAGSVATVATAGVVSAHISGLKEFYRWSMAFQSGVAAGDMYRLQRAVSWLPY